MKQLWITALLSLLLALIATPVIAEQPDGLSRNAQKAMKQYNKIYFNAGLAGLQKAIPNCYHKASHKKQREYTEQCMLLDLLSYHNQRELDSYGLRFDTPYLSKDNTSLRMHHALSANGMSDPTEQDQYIQIISNAAQFVIEQ